MDNKERLALAQWAMQQAIKSGADQAAVSLSNNRSINIEYRDKKIEKLQESAQNSLYLQIYTQKKFSGHSTNDLRKDSLEKFITEAVSGTKYLTADDFRLLPDPKYYNLPAVDLNIIDKGYSNIAPESRVAFASEIEKAALTGGPQIISASTSYADNYYEGVQVHSNGFEGSYSGTVFSAGASVTVKDAEGGRPEDWYYAATRFRSDLPDPAFLGRSAAERALKKIGQKKIESGQYDMLVENRAASRMISVITSAMSARALQQKASFLEGMQGKKIASELLTITDDPFIEKGMGSRLFDGDGIAAQKRVMIDKGVLKNYYIDNYYGRKLGMEPTSGGPSNLLFEPGSHSLNELVKNIKRGILVNGFIGGNSNATTGDFSFGIVGLLIENGEIIKPVNEMNISGNAKEFFNQLAAVGNDPYPYSSWKMPSMHFEAVNFSGI